jgi:hypothetical protein
MEQHEAGDGAAFAARSPDGSLTHYLTRRAHARSACAPRSWKCPRCPFNLALGNARRWHRGRRRGSAHGAPGRGSDRAACGHPLPVRSYMPYGAAGVEQCALLFVCRVRWFCGSARRGALAALHRPVLHARRRLHLHAGTDACVSLSRVRERGGRRANGDINVAVALYFDGGGDADEPAASPRAVHPADAASAHEDDVLEEQMVAFSMQVQQPPPSHHRPLVTQCSAQCCV